MIEDHDLYVMDRAFLEYGTYEIKIKARPELLVAAVMMCKFDFIQMQNDEIAMLRAFSNHYIQKEISTPSPHSKP